MSNDLSLISDHQVQCVDVLEVGEIAN